MADRGAVAMVARGAKDDVVKADADDTANSARKEVKNFIVIFDCIGILSGFQDVVSEKGAASTIAIMGDATTDGRRRGGRDDDDDTASERAVVSARKARRANTSLSATICMHNSSRILFLGDEYLSPQVGN